MWWLIYLLVEAETALLLFLIIVLPVLLTLLLILKLLHLSRFGIDKITLKSLLIVWTISCIFSAYRVIAPKISDIKSNKMVVTQATKLVQESDYPMLLSNDQGARYQIRQLDWTVILSSDTSFVQKPLSNKNDPYFQPDKGLCDVGSLANSKPSPISAEYMKCTKISTLHNGITLYQQQQNHGLVLGIYRDTLLVFDGQNIDVNSLNSLRAGSKNDLLKTVKSKNFNNGYDDALNRWYNKTVHNRCLQDGDSCKFSL